MSLTFTAQEIALGKALGLNNVSSQNDLNQIRAFASSHGVSAVNSQNDLNALIPRIQAPVMVSPGTNGGASTWSNPNNPGGGTYAGAPTTAPRPPAGIPAAASNGSSSNSSFNSMMMQMNQQIAQQQQAFAMQQQQAQMAAQMQAAQMQEMMATALAPAAPLTPAQSASGWQGAGDAAKEEIEALLLTSTASPSSLGVATPGALAAGSPSGKDLAALMIA